VTRMNWAFDIRDSVTLGVRLAQEKIRTAGTLKAPFKKIYEAFVNEVTERLLAQKAITISRASDFSSIAVGNDVYKFSPKQRRVIELLYFSWLKDEPSVSKATLLESIDSPHDRGLGVWFQRSKAWKELISRPSKDTYVLNIPSSLRSVALEFEARLRDEKQ
jgi:hypothetical protein